MGVSDQRRFLPWSSFHIWAIFRVSVHIGTLKSLFSWHAQNRIDASYPVGLRRTRGMFGNDGLLDCIENEGIGHGKGAIGTIFKREF